MKYLDLILISHLFKEQSRDLKVLNLHLGEKIDLKEVITQAQESIILGLLLEVQQQVLREDLKHLKGMIIQGLVSMEINIKSQNQELKVLK